MRDDTAQLRDLGWDQVRALLIFLVVVGHVIQHYLVGNYWENPLYKAIYLFHMPLFILLSGYFFSACLRPRAWERIPSQLRRLGLPILTVIIVQVALVLYRSWNSDLMPSVEALLGCVRGLWFLWVLLECVLAAVLCFALKSRIWRVLGCVAMMFIGDYLTYGSYFISLWPFFLLGLFLKYKGFHYAHIRLSWLWTLPLSMLAWYYYRSEWSLYYASTTWDLSALTYFMLRGLTAIVASMSFLVLAKLLLGLFKGASLVSIGQSTMAIYVLQTYLFFSGVGRGFLAKLGMGGEAMIVPLLTALVLTLAFYALYLLLKKVKLVRLFLFGEK